MSQKNTRKKKGATQGTKNFSDTTILEKNIDPKELAKIFLTREFIKLFDTKDAQRARWIKNQIKNLDKRMGEEALWNLLGEINDFKMKGVYQRLTDKSFIWNKETVMLCDLSMTGLSPEVDKVSKKCEWNFEKFARYWHTHPSFQKTLKKRKLDNFTTMPERDKFPVFVSERKYNPGQFSVFDGMRRCVVTAINGEKTITAYVGYAKRKDKPRVQSSNIFFLARLFHNAQNQDDELKKSFTQILLEVDEQFSDGRKTIKRVVTYPAKYREVLNLYKKIFKS